jgi:hypothetical protein
MNFPDPLHIAIALGPLATYFLVLGSVHLATRPLVVSGARDAAALALAIAGLVVVGPMELFLIEEAAVRYGTLVWAMMLVAYGLTVILVILLQRPRLVIYNISQQQLRPVLAEVVAQLDSEARWAGESLAMPQLGVQLYLESSPLFQNVQLVAAGPEQNLPGWKRLEKALAIALRKSRHRAQRFGVLATMAGLGTAALVTYVLMRDPGGVMHSLNEMLRR